MARATAWEIRTSPGASEAARVSASTAGARSSSRRQASPRSCQRRGSLGWICAAAASTGMVSSARPCFCAAAQTRKTASASDGETRPSASRAGDVTAPARPRPDRSPPSMAPTAARSPGERSGCQVSTIRMTRSASLSLAASCSIVSSKTHALPTSHSRRSAPTRNQQPGGTIKRQVADQAGVGDAVVGRDVGARREQREHRIGSAMRNDRADRAVEAGP